MSTKLPTKPGPYYWRKSDGDKWKLGNVFRNYDKRFYFETFTFNIGGKPVVDMGGQWLPIPTADELVELPAKAKAYDEGETAACIFCIDGKFVLARINAMLAWDDLEVIKMDIKRDLRKQGYTCSKVRVCKEVES